MIENSDSAAFMADEVSSSRTDFLVPFMEALYKKLEKVTGRPEDGEFVLDLGPN